MENVETLKEKLQQTASQKAEQAQAYFSEATEKAKVRSQEIWDEAADLIREYPAASIGVALVTGIVLGTMLARGGSDTSESVETAKEAVEGSDTWHDAKDGMVKTLGHLRGLIDDAITKINA